MTSLAHQFESHTLLTKTSGNLIRADRFILAMQATRNMDDVWNVMANQASLVGFEYLTYISIRADAASADTIIRSNLPDWWKEIYLTAQHVREDAIFMDGSDLKPKLIELELNDNSLDFQSDVARERCAAMREAGFCNGFVSPNACTDAARLSGWCFGSSMSRMEFIAAYAKYGAILRLFAICAHERIAAYSRLASGTKSKSEHLSARELECLKYLASGKRASSIAKMMSISPATVEFHVKGIKKKLSAATREEAVAKAITFGHITIRPEHPS